MKNFIWLPIHSGFFMIYADLMELKLNGEITFSYAIVIEVSLEYDLFLSRVECTTGRTDICVCSVAFLKSLHKKCLFSIYFINLSNAWPVQTYKFVPVTSTSFLSWFWPHMYYYSCKLPSFNYASFTVEQTPQLSFLSVK